MHATLASLLFGAIALFSTVGARAQSLRVDLGTGCMPSWTDVYRPVSVAIPAGTSVVVSYAYQYAPMYLPTIQAYDSRSNTYAVIGGVMDTAGSYAVGAYYTRLAVALQPGDLVGFKAIGGIGFANVCVHVAAFDGVADPLPSGLRWSNADFYVSDHYVSSSPDRVPAGALLHAMFLYTARPGNPTVIQPPAIGLVPGCTLPDAAFCLHSAYQVVGTSGIAAISSFTFNPLSTVGFMHALLPADGVFADGYESP